jgi:hypothetical protein
MCILAFLTDPGPVGAILRHLDLPDTAPRLAPARAPPQAALELEYRTRPKGRLDFLSLNRRSWIRAQATGLSVAVATAPALCAFACYLMSMIASLMMSWVTRR